MQLFGLNPSNKQINEILEKNCINKELMFHQLERIVIELNEDDMEDQLQIAFAKFDADKSGYIDEKLFQKFMCNYGEKLSQEEFQLMMKHVDNKNGRIKYSQLIEVLSKEEENEEEEELDAY